MQSDQAKYLVVIFGPPASGKSTLAKSIRQSYHSYSQEKNKAKDAVVISPDCFEEYLRNHTANELKMIISNKDQVEKIMDLKLKRSQFKQQNWKASRTFVRQALPQWFQMYDLIILQDDLLLKSQRKHIRHIAQQHQNVRYIQICINATLEECFANLKARSLHEQQQYTLRPQACKQAFQKFQLQQNTYLLIMKVGEKCQWSLISKSAKIVHIQHDEVRQKMVETVENAVKNEVETKIRKFISEIMSNKQLQNNYFKDRSLKEISSFLNVLKKKYCPKNKTFQGFLTFLKSETDQFL